MLACLHVACFQRGRLAKQWVSQGLLPPLTPTPSQADTKQVVQAASGFQYHPERPNATGFAQQKWGWSGHNPGAPGVGRHSMHSRWSIQTNTLYQPHRPTRVCRGLAGAGAGYTCHRYRSCCQSASGCCIRPAPQLRGKMARCSHASSSHRTKKAWLHVLLQFHNGPVGPPVVQHMGTALAACTSGCACNATRIDATWQHRLSLSEFHEFEVRVVMRSGGCVKASRRDVDARALSLHNAASRFRWRCCCR